MDTPPILVVDDEPDICKIFEKVIAKQGYTVVSTTTADGALEEAARLKPSVVLLDYMIPKMDGLAILGKIREISPASVVIIVTGQGDERIAARMMKTGAYDYLTKPINLPHLLRVVKEGMTVHRVRSEPLYQKLETSHRHLLTVHRRLEAMVNALQEGLVTFDTTHTIVDANPAAGRILGLDSREIIGRHCYEFLCNGSIPPECRPFSQEEETEGTMIDWEVPVQLADGRRRYLLKNTAVIRDEVGRISGGVETFLDITPLRELYREATRKEEELIRVRESLRSQRLLEKKNRLLTRRLGELTFLNRLGQRLNDTLDIRKAARTVVDHLKAQFEPAVVHFRIVGSEGGAFLELKTFSKRDISPDLDCFDPALSPGQPRGGGEQVRIYPIERIPNPKVRAEMKTADLASLAVIDLGTFVDYRGRILIFSQSIPHDTEMLKFLETVSHHLRAAFTTLALYKEKSHLAVTDGLTGIYNHKYFMERLSTEMERASRYDREISLILVDIDDFKAVNDRYGHPLGDRVLGSLAEVLKGGVRKVDLVARYGGEEFVILLMETGKRKALVSAERLRRSVSATAFGWDGVVIDGGMTISAGVATFPVDARTPGDLVRRADGALYAAKAAGKNQVMDTVGQG